MPLQIIRKVEIYLIMESDSGDTHRCMFFVNPYLEVNRCRHVPFFGALILS